MYANALGRFAFDGDFFSLPDGTGLGFTGRSAAWSECNSLLSFNLKVVI